MSCLDCTPMQIHYSFDLRVFSFDGFEGFECTLNIFVQYILVYVNIAHRIYRVVNNSAKFISANFKFCKSVTASKTAFAQIQVY